MMGERAKASWTTWLLGALALAFTLSHFAAIYTESINWDELALFHRAAETARTGILKGGGRPGLATVLLLPVVRDCADPIAVTHAARCATAVVTLALLAGVFALVRLVLRDVVEKSEHAAAFGVALLVCVPVFVRWSVHARTDQWCLAAGVWAGVALLASERRPWLSAISGLLWGIGWLFTQKVAYLFGLAGLLVAGRQLLLAPSIVWRRELTRVVVCALSAGAVVLLFKVWTEHAFLPAPPSGRSREDDAAFYRNLLGFEPYVGLLRTLGPHVVVTALMALATLASRTAAHRKQLGLACAVLALGLVVARVHASAFAYFWMTLGVFAAIAGALAIEPIRAMFQNPTLRGVLTAALWLALLAAVLPTTREIAEDTQRVQRDAMAFVEQAFPADARGFHPEGALFCRTDPDPFPVYLGIHIATRFKEPGAVEAFIDSFATKPVSFIVTSHRLMQFPAAVKQFWNEHYMLYGPGVLIPGFVLQGTGAQTIDVLIDGEYRFGVEPASARLEIEGRTLSSGQTIALNRGTHSVRLLDPVKVVTLRYAVKPAPKPVFDFYPPRVVRELDFR